MAVAWVLNFDADEELARPRSYSPRAAALAMRDELAARSGLVGPGDAIVDGSTRALSPMAGRAFCPTPRALAALASAGAWVPDAPALDVLRRVNDRAFCAALGRELPGSRLVRSADELEAAFAGADPATSWVLKRAFGFAGRGLRRVRPDELAAARTWVEASLRTGGSLVVEPWVERDADFGLHGHVSRDGIVVMGEPTVARVDERGAWIRTERAAASDLAAAELCDLREAGAETARALREAGYFGPFGIDAFRWRVRQGRTQFHPRCEINARYSMGWTVGMGSRRPDLP